MLLVNFSDIHFRSGEFGHSMDPNKNLRALLKNDVVDMCHEIGKTPDAILISGDIAYAGKKEEYDFAQSWLTDLCEACGISSSVVFIVPGNHDVQRNVAAKPITDALHYRIKKSKDEAELEQLLRKILVDAESANFMYQSIEPFNDFARQFECNVQSPNNTVAKRDLELNDGSILRILGLNSALVSSESDLERDLFVDPAIFQISQEPGVEHLVLCHHPYSWLRQGHELENHLHQIARIHLFGHRHTHRILPARDFISIASGALHPDKTESGYEPGYNLIEIEVSGTEAKRSLDIRVHARIWQQRPDQFIPKHHEKETVLTHQIALKAWSKPKSVVDQKSHSAATEGTLDSEKTQPGSLSDNSIFDDIRVRYLQLPYSQKKTIAVDLGLWKPSDNQLPDDKRFSKILDQAHEQGLIEEISEKIYSLS